MSKIKPEEHDSKFDNQELSTEVYVYETDTSSDESYDFKELQNKMKYLSYLYDTSIGNFPIGATIGLILTIISTIMIGVNFSTCQSILFKYNSNLSNMATYLYIVLGCLITLHTAVLSHGIAVGVLETSRELYKAKEVGCYFCCCKKKSTKCGLYCRKIQKCNQVTCQIVWAIIGTVFMFLFYLFTIGLSITSSISTIVSYLLLKTCSLYSDFIDQSIKSARDYVSQAKGYIGQADNVTTQFLYSYNKFVDLQQSFKNSAMNQINTIETNSYVGETKWMPEKYHDNCGRRLTMFDPKDSIAQGKSVLWTLNETIYNTENQINYYESELQKSVEFCNDYSSIYDSLYMVSVATVLLLVAHFIIFAVHNKYFTAWNYEARLIKNKDYD